MLLAIIAFIPFSLIIYGITLISTKLIVTENNDVEQKDKEEDNIYFENSNEISYSKSKKSNSFENTLEEFSIYD